MRCGHVIGGEFGLATVTDEQSMMDILLKFVRCVALRAGDMHGGDDEVFEADCQ
ncbi:MAG: hypothetical protein Q9M15_00490 [Mariprofundaceae bacterium]|nr:hypothetical protein [Mariprofundaceae bacterium]